MNPYELWVDGACKKTRVGGWAYAIVRGEKILETRSSSVANTTNNRMELVPVIQGLKRFSPCLTSKIEIFSDSAYVVNCFVKEWYVKWRKNNWIGTSNNEIANQDLWKELLKVVEAFPEGSLTWTHIRGHSGIEKNEYVDSLAAKASLELEQKMKQEGTLL